MNFSELWQSAVDFYHAYPLLIAGIGIVVLVWAWKKPKQATKGFLFLAFIALVFYVLSLLGEGTDSSTRMKDSMMRKTEQALEE